MLSGEPELREKTKKDPHNMKRCSEYHQGLHSSTEPHTVYPDVLILM